MSTQNPIKLLVLPTGESSSVSALVGMMARHKDKLLGIWRFSSPEGKIISHTYAAAFEKEWADYLCVIAPDGAGEGKGYRGEGYVAYRLIEAFLEENEIEVYEGAAKLEPGDLSKFIEGEVISAITHHWSGRCLEELSDLRERVLQNIRRETTGTS